MKGLEVTLDGIKYFVTVETWKSYEDFGVTLTLRVRLYLDTMRSSPIYSEIDRVNDYQKYDVRKAKKFVKRALAKV